jgi:hypothetical protein
MKNSKHRPHVSAAVMTVLVAALALAGCSRSGSEFLGKWSARDIDVTITRSGSQYVVACKNPDGLMNGTFTGSYEKGLLKLPMDMLGDMGVSYLKGEDSIVFAGAKLKRVK